jgi:hypothetical protein
MALGREPRRQAGVRRMGMYCRSSSQRCLGGIAGRPDWSALTGAAMSPAGTGPTHDSFDYPVYGAHVVCHSLAYARAGVN